MVDKVLQRILVVDDEPNIVNAVQRALIAAPGADYRYEVEGFTDPLRALERARAQAFDAVICDYRMPDMDGMAFLKALAQIQPDCARIVLSGQTDMAGLVRMVNETHIYRFISKPWHDRLLKNSLAQALDYRATLLEHRRLAALIRNNDILTLPVPAREVEQLLIVDDDLGVLNSLSRILRHHSQVDDVYAAIRAEMGTAANAVLHEDLISVQVTPSPLHALKMAETVSYACIVADYRMPEMNGVELLRRFSELQPDCARILISAEINADALVEAVDSANIFAFLDKPWSDFEMKSQIALALSRRRMLRGNRLLAEMVTNSARPD